MLWGALLPAADQLSRSKILYFSGKITYALSEIEDAFKRTDAPFEVKVWYARLLSETGRHKDAHDILVQLDPIKESERIGVLFLKNLLRWKMIRQAKMYIPKLDTGTPQYSEVCGDLFFSDKKYRKALKNYLSAVERGGEKGMLYYKAAKAAYCLRKRDDARDYISLSRKHAKSRMILLNLSRFGKLL